VADTDFELGNKPAETGRADADSRTGDGSGAADAVASDGSADDDDTFDNPRAPRRTCTSPEDYVAGNTDCIDSSAISYPGATEICDSIDNDCNGSTDESLVRTCTTACGSGSETCRAGTS
jgi:hypothetical protein